MTAATQTFKARLRRIAPYFAGTRRGLHPSVQFVNRGRGGADDAE